MFRGLSVNSGSPCVIQDFKAPGVAQELAKAFDGVSTLALDAEGVDLSRAGRVSIVQLATPDKCFLFDVLDKTAGDPLVQWLRGPLEDETVVKIIHDCRMDSDSLFHLLNISLASVHDTSCWATVQMGGRLFNLNDVLELYGLKRNTIRDGNVYKTNHAFWETRPLTARMIDWASGDVALMFELQNRQLQRGVTKSARTRIDVLTGDYLTDARSAKLATITVCCVGPGISYVVTMVTTY